MARIGVFASRPQYAQHLNPIFDALTLHERAYYYQGLDQFLPSVESVHLWVTAASRDFESILNKQRKPKCFYMEHGTGLQAHTYNTLKDMENALAIGVPNEFTKKEIQSNQFQLSREPIVIGTPKMDYLLKIPDPENEVIALSFHWTGHGQNMRRWEPYIRRMRRDFKFIGHAHPHLWPQAEPMWKNMGIEPVRDFEEVVRRASYYMCDHSSTIYEWAALDRPVILMHRWQSKNMFMSTGLRYEYFPDVGPEARIDQDPAAVIRETLKDHGDSWLDNRHQATEQLYPYLGHATERALSVIREVTGG